MKFPMISFRILLILLLSISGNFCDNFQLSDDNNDDRLSKINDYFQRFVEKTHTPCMNVGLLHRNLIWIKSFGPGADLENNVPCQPWTMLRVASVSKAIGSGLIASMVENERLYWDDNIYDLIPNDLFPPKSFNNIPSVNITIRQLISHQSGIRNSNEKDLSHDWEFRILNSTGLLSWFANDSLKYLPGHGYLYSNHGWSMLGAIVEILERRPYHQVLEDYMRSVVGMPTATSETRDRLILNRGRQYFIDSTGQYSYPPIEDNTRPFPHWPAGGVIATVSDLLEYGRKILYSYKGIGPEQILKSKTLEEMWNYRNGNISVEMIEIKLDDLKGAVAKIESSYVMGWEKLKFPDNIPGSIFNNLTFISHSGQIESTNAKLAIIPEYDFVFATIMNRGGLLNDLNKIALDTFSTLLSPKKKEK